MNLQELSDKDLADLLETKRWQLEIEDTKTYTWLSHEPPYASIFVDEYTDLYHELIDDISWIEDEILTRECENMLQ